MKCCDNNNNNNNNSTMCHKDLTNNNNAMNNDNNRLPTVLYPYNNSIEQSSCDPNMPFFINEVASSINTRHHYIIHSNDAIIRNQSFIHAENTIRSINNNHTVGSNRLPNHWEFYEDRKGKPGWIIEGDFMHHNNSSIHNSNNNNDAHISHSILLSERKDILSFPIKYILTNDTIVTRVSYLRTYENAGIIEIILCGKTLSIKLDALWEDYMYHHVSLPDVYYFGFTNEDKIRCYNLKPNERLLSFRRLRKDEIDEDENKLKLRDKFKFKILMVTMCVSLLL